MLNLHYGKYHKFGMVFIETADLAVLRGLRVPLLVVSQCASNRHFSLLVSIALNISPFQVCLQILFEAAPESASTSVLGRKLQITTLLSLLTQSLKNENRTSISLLRGSKITN